MRRTPINRDVSPHPPPASSSRHPSSASSRPPSSAGVRPSSRASLASLASLSVPGARAASRLSTVSALSARPSSRFSTHSTHSTRPGTRLSTRVAPHTDALVRAIIGLDPDEDPLHYDAARAYVVQVLETGAGAGAKLAMSDIDKRIRGHAQKARITVKDNLAKALEASYTKLKTHLKEQEQDLDSDIQHSRVPDHLQLLLLLSSPPTTSTLDYAAQYVHELAYPPKPPGGLTWAQILAEDPLEGQHWEGAYGLPPGSTPYSGAAEDRERWSSDSEGSLGSGDDFQLEMAPIVSDPEDTSLSSMSDLSQLVGDDVDFYGETDVTTRVKEAYEHKKATEALQKRQYWRADWKSDINTSRKFDLGDASTLGPAVRRGVAETGALKVTGPENERYIYEHDAYREVLMALQGYANLLIARQASEGDEVSNEGKSQLFVPQTGAPRLVHLTLASYHSILASFAQTCSVATRLRHFVSVVYQSSLHLSGSGQTSRARTASSTPSAPAPRPSWPTSSAQHRTCLTLEAFAESVEHQLNRLLTWCVHREEALLSSMAEATSSSPVIASLLSLQHELKKEFDVVLGSFDTIIRLLELDKAATRTQRNAPAALAKRILDALLSSAHAAYTRGEPTAASALLDAFVASAEPVWSMMLAWLRNGPQASTSIGAVAGGVLGGTSPSLLGVDPEFFIEDNELPLLDSDFWNEGLVLRVEGGGYGEHEKVVVPQCMEGLANQVLGAGKAVALLRVLDLSALDGDGGAGVNTSALSLSLSASCEQLRALSSLKDLLASSTHTRDIFSTEDFLANVIHDNLVPYCRAMQAELVRVISTKCDLWYHFGAIEKLFLMRRGDIAGGFADTVFARIDARLPWTDFHFLNISLQDTLLHPPQDWVGPTLVRLSYKRNTASLSTRSVEALAGIRLEYAVPYPLTYLLHPSAMQIYGDVWSLLLQLRRAKSVLERILVRGGQEEGESTSKVMWALRSRLAWFVNTFFNYIVTNVIETQILQFHEAVRHAMSFDSMISLHDRYLDGLRTQCLLSSKSESLHRSIVTVLDDAVRFGDIFAASTSDITLDLSRASLGHAARHRSKRARRERRNVVSFTQDIVESSSSSSDDEDEDLASRIEHSRSMSMAASEIHGHGGDPAGQLERMAVELDAHVRLVRRGVETLATGSGSGSDAYSMLAFALEDWDR